MTEIIQMKTQEFTGFLHDYPQNDSDGYVSAGDVWIDAEGQSRIVSSHDLESPSAFESVFESVTGIRPQLFVMEGSVVGIAFSRPVKTEQLNFLRIYTGTDYLELSVDSPACAMTPPEQPRLPTRTLLGMKKKNQEYKAQRSRYDLLMRSADLVLHDVGVQEAALHKMKETFASGQRIPLLDLVSLKVHAERTEQSCKVYQAAYEYVKTP